MRIYSCTDPVLCLCLGLAFEIHIMNTVPVHQMTFLLLIISVGCSRWIGKKCYSDLYNKYWCFRSIFLSHHWFLGGWMIIFFFISVGVDLFLNFFFILVIFGSLVVPCQFQGQADKALIAGLSVGVDMVWPRLGHCDS